MSVLIKGMDMPSECRGCKLMDYDINTGKTWCFPADAILAEDYKSIDFDGRPDWCPLVEVKEPHGDMIDRDELIKDLEHDVAIDQDSLDYEELTEINRSLIQSDKDIKQNVIDLLEHASRIIEAEGVEE